MTVSELDRQIKSGTVDKFLIFSGDDWSRQKEYVDRVAQSVGARVVRVESVARVFPSLVTKSLFADRRVIVVRDDAVLIRDDALQKRLYEALEFDTVILLWSALDKRTRLYKAFQKHVVEFPTVQDDSPVAFRLVDAVLGRMPSKAFALYRECVGRGESVLMMLSVLYSNVKALLQVQSFRGSADQLREKSGLTWQVDRVKQYIGNYGVHELVDMLKSICNYEQAIKTGRLDESVVIELLLVEFL